MNKKVHVRIFHRKELIESLHTDAIHDPQFLSHLREETGGNECQIFEMLLHLRNTGLSDLIMPLIEEMEKSYPNIRMETREQSRMMNALWDYTMEGRYSRNKSSKLSCGYYANHGGSRRLKHIHFFEYK